MNDHHDTDENDDHEAQLHRFLDETRVNLENPPDDLATLFPKVDFPGRLLGASDDEREQFLSAAAHRAVFDPDPYWRRTDMPQYVLRELRNAGVSQAVQAWVAYVLREGKIPHAGKGRAADMWAKSDYRHNLAMFILDHETLPKYCTKAGKPTMNKLLEDAGKALPKGDGTAKQTYYDGGTFQDYLDACRRQREYLKTVELSK